LNSGQSRLLATTRTSCVKNIVGSGQYLEGLRTGSFNSLFVGFYKEFSRQTVEFYSSRLITSSESVLLLGVAVMQKYIHLLLLPQIQKQVSTPKASFRQLDYSLLSATVMIIRSYEAVSF